MANTSTTTKKTRGAAKAATPAKRTKRTGNNKKAPVKKEQGDVNKDETVSPKLDAVMESMAALSGKMQVLSGCVDAAEEWEKDGEMPLVMPVYPEGGPVLGGPQTLIKKWQKTSIRGWPRG